MPTKAYRASVLMLLSQYPTREVRPRMAQPTQTYCERIATFYRVYCPEKPASHVDFLLAKYKGHEEAVMEILRDKYGPEPEGTAQSYHRRVDTMLRADGDVTGRNTTTDTLLDAFDQQEPVLVNALAGRVGTEPHKRLPVEQPALIGDAASHAHMEAGSADLEAALAERHRQFQTDMRAIATGHERSHQLATMQAVAEARLEAQRQEVEIQQLRLSVSAQAAQASANDRAFDEAIQQSAKQLTAAKLRRLKLESTRNTTVVPVSDFEEVVEKTTATEMDFDRSVQYCRMLADVVQRHLRLHPMSPMHATLRQLDPALAARLEQ